MMMKSKPPVDVKAVFRNGGLSTGKRCDVIRHVALMLERSRGRLFGLSDSVGIVWFVVSFNRAYCGEALRWCEACCSFSWLQARKIIGLSDGVGIMYFLVCFKRAYCVQVIFLLLGPTTSLAQNEAIADVEETLQCSRSQAMILLRHYRWDRDKLLGAPPPSHVNSQLSASTCLDTRDRDTIGPCTAEQCFENILFNSCQKIHRPGSRCIA